MKKFIDSFSKIMQRGHTFQIVFSVLVLAIVLAGVYVTNFANLTPNDFIVASTESIPQDDLNDDEIRIEDPNASTSPDADVVTDETDETDETDDEDDSVTVSDSDGSYIVIPKYDYPISTISYENFSSTDGVVSYSGTSYIGIDVSNIQGDIDWAEVKASGVDYAMIRVGYRGATKGALNLDASFIQNIEGAIENDIMVGVYFFSQATSISEAEAEATFVLDAIKDYSDYIDFPVVFDWEYVEIEDNRTSNIKGSDVSDFAVAFATKIEKAGYTPAIYLNKYMAYEVLDLDKFTGIDLWVAEFELFPSFYYQYTMWQYTDQGVVNGIDTNVDLNICFKSYG